MRVASRFSVLGIALCLSVCELVIASDADLAGFESAPQPPIGVESVDMGIVEALEPERGSIVIEGYRYLMAADVPVDMMGIAATTTALAVGMPVHFRLVRVPGELPRLLEVRVVPPDRRIIRR